VKRKKIKFARARIDESRHESDRKEGDFDCNREKGTKGGAIISDNDGENTSQNDEGQSRFGKPENTPNNRRKGKEDFSADTSARGKDGVGTQPTRP